MCFGRSLGHWGSHSSPLSGAGSQRTFPGDLGIDRRSLKNALTPGIVNIYLTSSIKDLAVKVDTYSDT